MTPQVIARALGGQVVGRDKVRAPGPGHSRMDRSLEITLDLGKPEGFSVRSYSTRDNWKDCRDYVRSALGLPSWQPEKPRARQSIQIAPAPDDRPVPHKRALEIWGEAISMRGTLAERYLTVERGLDLGPGLDGRVLRYHPRLSLGDGHFAPAMVALFRSIEDDEPQAIHRTFLTASGRKLCRKMLGPVRGAAIKLDPDPSVTTGLHIGEGVETCIAARLAGLRPAWALGSAGAIAAFPVLAGIECLSIFGEINDHGANERAAQDLTARWSAAGCEVRWLRPLCGDDLADAWHGVAP